MKYAIISDIHANQQAWNAVLLDIRSRGADRIICLGDSIGYGPNPAEVLESLHGTVDHFVLGNHEAALCGKIDDESFNPEARAAIAWTRTRVSRPAVQFLLDHPLTLAGPGFRCAHAEFAEAGRFCYAFTAYDATPSWNTVPEPLLFIGHTHRPCIMVLGRSGIPRMTEPEDFLLEKGKRFLVNVGSVGQPRDGGTLSTYCLFDDRAGAVYWRRLPFDLDAFREAHYRAGLPVAPGSFLELDPRKRRAPLREQVPFHPPAEPVRDTPDVQYVDRLRRKARKWKMMFMAGSMLLALTLTIGIGAWLREKTRTVHVGGTRMMAVRAADFAPESNLLSFPEAAVQPGSRLPHWNLSLGDRYKQQASWTQIEQDTYGFVLGSGSHDAEMRLGSAPVHVAPDMRLRLQGYVKGGDDFSGNIAFALVLVQRTGSAEEATLSFETNRNFVVKEPTLRRRDGWSLAQQTIDLPARSHSVTFEIRGKFQGVAHVRGARLERR